MFWPLERWVFCKQNPYNIFYQSMLPHYLSQSSNLRQVVHQVVVSPSVMVSVGISKLGFTDLIFVHPGMKINGGYYRDMLLSQQLLPWCATCQAISSSFNKTAHLHTGHATLCDFLSRQQPLSFIQICRCQITPTLIRSITRYGLTSSSECISRSCTALTKWRSVCWKLGRAWTRGSLTMQETGAMIAIANI